MKALGSAYKNAEAREGGDYQKLPAGGYVVRILQVTNIESKQYLDLVFDIAEGEYKGFYVDEWGAKHPYAHHIVLSYKDTALGMFKARLRAIDESNNTGFEAAAETGLQEQALTGKIVGVLIGYEEYVSNQGEIRQRTDVRRVVPVSVIRSGDFKIPDVKPLKPDSGDSTGQDTAPQGFTWASDAPF